MKRQETRMRSRTVFGNARAAIYAAILGVALNAINFLPATILTPLGFGSALAAIWGGLTAPFFFAFASLVTRRYGTVMILYISYSLLAMPTFVMGPPHPYKPVLALMAGLAYELGILLGGGFRHRSLYVAITIFTIISIVNYVMAFRILDLPGREILEKSILVFGAVFLVLSWIATALAIKFHKRIGHDARLTIFSDDKCNDAEGKSRDKS